MNCNASHDAAEHIRQAGEHLHQAARTWSDHLIAPDVRAHLRSAARSVLQAGIAALDAREAKAPPAERPVAEPAAAQPA